MVPVEHLFRRFPRIVRDVAKLSGKEVELVMTGETTELDKTILDALAEPLTHLLRNAVDHGIESPQERVAAGKPGSGTIWLKAYHQGSQIVIEASDDGRGIERERLASKALERGIVTRTELQRMNEAECLNLVFHPGFSTAEQVTEISGRGVGMDVVKTVLDGLKGNVQIETVPGQGTTFRLKVPLTMAIIKALLFRLGDRLYAVPLNSVLEITRTSEDQIHRVEQHEVIQLRNEVITLVRLDRWMSSTPRQHRRLFMIIVGIADRKFGLIVDKLAGEEELVIKALDDHLVSTDLVSGASILGDGNVVLILNTPVVVSRFARDSAPERALAAAAAGVLA
jgi:two-component system chemotaxis sensor kinase CheA